MIVPEQLPSTLGFQKDRNAEYIFGDTLGDQIINNPNSIIL
jgi:hypothetical protein